MPSAALKFDSPSPDIDPDDLFDRLRKNGFAAVQVAGWLPAFLKQDVPGEDQRRVESEIDSCRIECEIMVVEAETADYRRLAETARKVLGLWEMIAEKNAAQRSQPGIALVPLVGSSGSSGQATPSS